VTTNNLKPSDDSREVPADLFWPDLRGQGWRIEFQGKWVAELPTPPIPSLTIAFESSAKPDDHLESYLQVHTRIARREGSPIFVCIRWHPERANDPLQHPRETAAIGGLEYQKHDVDELRQADRMAKRLLTLKQALPGRPQNTAEWFIPLLDQGWREAHNANGGRRPTRKHVADAMGFGQRWFDKQFKQHVGAPRKIRFREYQPS
jgi:hypothetical protein